MLPVFIVFVVCVRQLSDASVVARIPNIVCKNGTEFSCLVYDKPSCLFASLLCNGRSDCDNGEDEKDCEKICSDDKFLCNNSTLQQCIFGSFRCDGDKDCENGEDEENCSSYKCPSGMFPCFRSTVGRKCIKGRYRCDGDTDCENGEDEEDCSNYQCGSDQFLCSNSTSKRCIPSVVRCDGIRNCPEGEDELNCFNYDCNNEQFTCYKSEQRCTRAAFRCDGGKDCSNGEDEEGCDTYVCPNGLFTCSNSTSKRCVPVSVQCDGDSDCPYGEDEGMCGRIQCRANQFTCHKSRSRCTAASNRCDGHRDCEEGEDEENCPKFKIFKNCEVLLKLLEHNIPWESTPDWLCIVNNTSKYNTGRRGGLFQISGVYWCGIGKGCNMSCEALTDDDISDDIECAKLIHQQQGFSAFPAWSLHCNAKSSHRQYTDQCLPIPGQYAPNITNWHDGSTISFINGSHTKCLTCTASGFPYPTIEWFYDKSLFPGACQTQQEFKQRDGPKTENTVNLCLHDIKNIAAQTKFDCTARNHLGLDKAVFEVEIIEAESLVYFPYEIVLPLLLLSLIVVVACTVIVYRKYFIKVGLTAAEVKLFIHGDSQASKEQNNSESNVSSNPYDYSYEIEGDKLQINRDQVLGTGEFGIIFKGRYNGNDVAVKTVNANTDKTYIKSLMNEVKVMIHIGEHPSIVNIIGAQTKELIRGVLNIVFEFCDMGDIGNFMRTNRGAFADSINGKSTTLLRSSHYQNVEIDFSSRHLLNWSLQIASAMEYIGSKNVIHGDLASRNVLLLNKDNIKLIDFGLSKHLQEYTQYVKKGQAPLPWRWLAYESLTTLSFTKQSDIWSFGVTLWEIFSLGDLPYPGLNWTLDFPAELEQGLRLLKPKFANDTIYGVMLSCWDISAEARISWKKIQEILKKIDC